MIKQYAKILYKVLRLEDSIIAICLFVIAFFLRFGYAVWAYFTQTLPESMLYYELAQEILEEGKIFYGLSNYYYETVGPGLPWLNALTMLVFGINYLGLYLVSAIGSALITFFTYKTARLLFSKETSLLAGIWSLFYFYYFYFAPTPGKDIWMAFFMILLIYLLLLLFLKKRFTYSKYVLFIVFFVFSFHLDERFFLLTPFVLIYILYHESDGFRLLKIKKTVIFLGLVIILMIPWSIRNYVVHDKFVLISTRTQSLTDGILGYDEDEYIIDNFMDLYGLYYIPDYQIDSVIAGTINETDLGHSISEKQREAMARGNLPEALNSFEKFWLNTRIFLRPFQFVKGEYQKTGYYYYEQSLRNKMASALFYGVILLFSIPGFYFLYRKNKHGFFILFSVILIYTLIHTFLIPFTTWRYRLPLDAVFIIVGSFCFAEVFFSLIRRRIG